MPLKIFNIQDSTKGEEEYLTWIEANPGIRITSKHLCSHTPAPDPRYPFEDTFFDRLYVFYDLPGEAQFKRDQALIEQNAQWDMCLDLAKTLKGDANYSKLKNKDQRRLHLLSVYNIPRDDADVVETILQMYKMGVLNAKPAKRE